MENTLTILLMAFFLVLACVLLLGIGLWVTGKSKLRTGMCGKIPQKGDKASDCEEKRKGCCLCGSDRKDE